VAQVHYSLYHYTDAQELFEDLLSADPYCLAGMDIYSNILYVTEQAGQLTHLAHRLAETHKYTPEACCVMGNYYSLKVGGGGQGGGGGL
jgi:anaphase-promoting complex subunit 8